MGQIEHIVLYYAAYSKEAKLVERDAFEVDRFRFNPDSTPILFNKALSYITLKVHSLSYKTDILLP